MKKQAIQDIVDLYFKAWATQDSNLLPSIFRDDAIYRVKPFGKEEYTGLPAITEYWLANTVAKQIKPNPTVLAQAITSNSCFVEWETKFITSESTQKTVRGILVLFFKGGLVSELREYYSSVEV